MKPEEVYQGSNVIKFLVLLLTTSLIFYLLLRNIETEEIISELLNANGNYVFFAFFLSLFFAVLSAHKWKIFIDMIGQRISYSRCQKITVATYALNVIIPSKGGDLVKCWSVRDKLSVSRSIGIMLLERLMDLCVLGVMACVGGVVLHKMKVVIVSVSIVLGCLFAILVIKNLEILRIRERFLTRLNEIGYAARALPKHPKRTAWIVLIVIMIWFGSCFQIYILYKAVGRDVPILYAFTVVPVVILIGFIPVTIGGMGIRDAGLVYLFAQYACASTSISVGIMFSVLRYWCLGLLGVPFLGYLKGKMDSGGN